MTDLISWLTGVVDDTELVSDHGDPVDANFEIATVSCPNFSFDSRENLTSAINVGINESFLLEFKTFQGSNQTVYLLSDLYNGTIFFINAVGIYIRVNNVSANPAFLPVLGQWASISRIANSNLVTCSNGVSSSSFALSNAAFSLVKIGNTANSYGQLHGMRMTVGGVMKHYWPCEDGTPDNPSTVIRDVIGGNHIPWKSTDYESTWSGERAGYSYNADKGFNLTAAGYIPASSADPTRDVLGNALSNPGGEFNGAPIEISAKATTEMIEADTTDHGAVLAPEFWFDGALTPKKRTQTEMAAWTNKNLAGMYFFDKRLAIYGEPKTGGDNAFILALIEV